MKNDLNTTLSNLLNTFELINLAFKDKGDPLLLNYTITEMHCIEHIGKLENPNVTKLSKALQITRGGISKMIKKLINKKTIEAYSHDINKKEIYYRLTTEGQAVFNAHEELHKKWKDKDKEFFKQFDEKEVKIAVTFIKKYTEHLKKSLEQFNWSN